MAFKGIPRTGLIILLLGLAVAAVLSGRHLLHRSNQKKWREWPVSLEEPLLIPTQAGFPDSGGDDQSPAEAQEAWKRALNGFRSASSDDVAVKQTAPLLREIWSRWPDSDFAVRAQLFSLKTLASYGSDEAGLQPSSEFIERAIQSPHAYFSREHQASTQTVAVQVIQTLIEENKTAQAAQLCIRLRWLAPRVDLIAPTCHRLMDFSPDIAPAPKLTLGLLSPLVATNAIPPEKLTWPLAKAVQQYLSHPYDEDALAQAIIELHKANFKAMAGSLLLELQEVDPMEEPYVEVDIDKLEAAGQ